MVKHTISAIVSIIIELLLLCTSDLRLVWSNFEIGDLDLWRGEAYTKFFDFLEEKGGFYYEVSLSILFAVMRMTPYYFCSVGAMRQYTVLERHYSQRKSRL